jgi:hypothetical protein
MTAEKRARHSIARLLELYALKFLARHRADMLQNFEDLENAAPSKIALWLLIGNELLSSHISRNIPKSLRGLTSLMIVIFAMVLALLWAPTHIITSWARWRSATAL